MRILIKEPLPEPIDNPYLGKLLILNVSDVVEVDIDDLLIEFFNRIGESGEDLEFEIREKRILFSDFLEDKLNLKGGNDEKN